MKIDIKSGGKKFTVNFNIVPGQRDIDLVAMAKSSKDLDILHDAIDNRNAGEDLPGIIIAKALEKKLKLSVIRQILADSGAREFDGLFKVLYDNVSKYTNREGEAILIIAKYQYEYTFVLEKEICIAAMLNKLLDIC